MSRPVEVLLWDCDGVLQHGRFDWRSRLDGAVRPGFARRVFEAELPALRGERPLREVLEELLRLEQEQSDHVPISVEDLLAIWEQFDLDPEAIAVLTAVRDLGVPCMLATNQQDHRVQHMREVRGYDDLVDGSYYSSEIGAMKPDRIFFERVLDDLGLSGDRVGFVDDVPANVESARSVGIRAVLHDPASGAAGLVADLTPLVPGLADLSLSP
ncbi:HAD family hydrolase [Janibacter hoylei]|uniref:Hydrolase n=1 Tax=Janibacter hoylei PVAS-1 TaxID=1210046 RepID=K1EMU0_9MICO|nr:HAD-IA family hydrolase [Janibacter hoylei]EKA60608.1 HAD-superfamily hydrolase [Janibacter hoylei PVAS-1]MCT1617705.1 HAD-IA family hydrolase [Janibacter hoylei]MCT2292373.1 HAD-IA family hydrolase [Janibacter hoylei]MCW4600639.1 HAD-IA family hydrolase [Janibacter hoylei]RWU81497.1 hydrolase [Janibacter hoylei PVAS-1]